MKRTGFKPRQQTLSQRAALKKVRKPNPLKPDTRSTIKKGPLRDPEHLALVRQVPCFVCYNGNAIEAHHIRECFPRTMGVRVGDDKTVPLCQACHIELHKHSRSFWEGTEDSTIAYATALFARTQQKRSAS